MNTAPPIVAQAFNSWPLETLSPSNMSLANPLLLQTAPIGLMECPHQPPRADPAAPMETEKPQLRKGYCTRYPNSAYRRC